MILGEIFDLYKEMKETGNKNYLGKHTNFFSYFNIFKRVWAIRTRQNLLQELYVEVKYVIPLTQRLGGEKWKYAVVLYMK